MGINFVPATAVLSVVICNAQGTMMQSEGQVFVVVNLAPESPRPHQRWFCGDEPALDGAHITFTSTRGEKVTLALEHALIVGAHAWRPAKES